MRIGNDLIEAYTNTYEDDLHVQYNAYTEQEISKAGGTATVESHESWIRDQVVTMIRNHSAQERLEIYLTWNGILGYSNRIYAIATGEL